MGGAEIQNYRERDLFCTKGHKVIVLTFDNSFPAYQDSEWINMPIKIENRLNRWIDKLWGTKSIREELNTILAKVDPDFIHLNGVFSIPLDVMDCIKKYKTIQTIRDYSAVCPCGTCVDKNNMECKGYAQASCFRCGHFDVKCFYNYLALKIINKKRKVNLNAIITPSRALAEKCNDNGLNAQCINNPFDFTKIKLKTYKDFNGTKLYLYYGLIAKNKGIRELISAFENFAKHHDVKLIMIGKVYSAFEQEFEQLKNKQFLTYLGQKEFNEIMDLYPEIYCVIVPSLWIENYPNTVLEALANKTLVIGSNRGGIPEMIQDDNLLFDILDRDDVIAKMNYSFSLNVEKYKQITDNGYERVSSNNTLENYYNKLVFIYESL